MDTNARAPLIPSNPRASPLQQPCSSATSGVARTPSTTSAEYHENEAAEHQEQEEAEHDNPNSPFVDQDWPGWPPLDEQSSEHYQKPNDPTTSKTSKKMLRWAKTILGCCPRCEFPLCRKGEASEKLRADGPEAWRTFRCGAVPPLVPAWPKEQLADRRTVRPRDWEEAYFAYGLADSSTFSFHMHQLCCNKVKLFPCKRSTIHANPPRFMRILHDSCEYPSPLSPPSLPPHLHLPPPPSTSPPPSLPPSLPESCMTHGAAACEAFHFVTGQHQPLTARYAVESVAWPQLAEVLETRGEKKLLVHLVGCEGEFLRLPEFRTYFVEAILASCGVEVQLAMIGNHPMWHPDENPKIRTMAGVVSDSSGMIGEREGDSGSVPPGQCSSGRKIDLHFGDWHELLAQGAISAPDLVIGLDAGLYTPPDEGLYYNWMPTLQKLRALGIPAVFTDRHFSQAVTCCAELKFKAGVPDSEILMPIMNPFRRMVAEPFPDWSEVRKGGGGILKYEFEMSRLRCLFAMNIPHMQLGHSSVLSFYLKSADIEDWGINAAPDFSFTEGAAVRIRKGELAGLSGVVVMYVPNVGEYALLLQNDALPVQTIERPSFKMTLNAAANPDELERYLIPGRGGIAVPSESSTFRTGPAPGAEKKDEDQYRVFGVWKCSQTAEKRFPNGALVRAVGLQSEKGRALNGKYGRVDMYDAETNRYGIRFGWFLRELVAIRGQNLEL